MKKKRGGGLGSDLLGRRRKCDGVATRAAERGGGLAAGARRRRRRRPHGGARGARQSAASRCADAGRTMEIGAGRCHCSGAGASNRLKQCPAVRVCVGANHKEKCIGEVFLFSTWLPRKRKWSEKTNCSTLTSERHSSGQVAGVSLGRATRTSPSALSLMT